MCSLLVKRGDLLSWKNHGVWLSGDFLAQEKLNISCLDWLPAHSPARYPEGFPVCRTLWHNKIRLSELKPQLTVNSGTLMVLSHREVPFVSAFPSFPVVSVSFISWSLWHLYCLCCSTPSMARPVSEAWKVFLSLAAHLWRLEHSRCLADVPPMPVSACS